MVKGVLVLVALITAFAATAALSGRPDPVHPGLALARTHCIRCHLMPDPADLPREKWPFAIAWMGNYLGYANTEGSLDAIVDRREIPDWKVVSPEGLRLIEEYFVTHSRSGGAGRESAPLPQGDLESFQAFTPPTPGLTGSMTTLLHLDESRGRLYAGFADTRSLYVYDRRGTPILASEVPSAPVAVEPAEGGFRLTLMGGFERDRGSGQVVEVTDQGAVTPIVQGYHRLAGSRTADLDADGHGDLILAGFGDYSDGRVSILWKNGTTVEEQILESRSGALGIGVNDFDGDGDLDLLVLLAQAHQELLAFRNDGPRTLTRIVLHKKRAGFGYNHLSLADLNGDGRMDIVTSSGNNMELVDPPLRPHHGVRVLINTGGFTFVESVFLPLHGALQSVAHDFDEDGDLDIVSIAFYPDWSPEFPRTFAYFENVGDLEFRLHTLPDERWGRWMALHVTDYDGDGRKDILLGSASMSAGIPTRLLRKHQARLRSQLPILVLLNRY